MTTSAEYLQQMADEINVHLSAGDFDTLTANLEILIRSRVVDPDDCPAALVAMLLKVADSNVLRFCSEAKAATTDTREFSSVAELAVWNAVADSWDGASTAFFSTTTPPPTSTQAAEWKALKQIINNYIKWGEDSADYPVLTE